MPSVSIIIPAYEEEERIGDTLSALRTSGNWFQELIVVDDGSRDQTYAQALPWTRQVFRLPRNQGKAAALEFGVRQAAGSILLFLDADLQQSAGYARLLAEPIQRDEADMTVAIFPQAKQGGFGLVKKLASQGIYAQTGIRLEAPLCGQRALKKEVFETCYRGDRGFGVEVGLTLDCLQAGYRIKEISIDFKHREMGRNVRGFVHRAKQGVAVIQALQRRH